MAKFVIADDSLIFRKTLSSILENMGHEVTGVAEDGIHAYLKCEETKPDAVTLDINMPLMGGIETIPKIAKSFPDIKIILISSSRNRETVETALKSGAASFLIKPITKKKIEQSINKLF